MNSLKGKRILITAGPTWVAIDDVRVISNVSSGELGIILAQRARGLGMKVDLMLGPIGKVDLGNGIAVHRFKYFNELLDLVKNNLKVKKYNFILHAAAVSDYLAQPVRGKISSSQKKVLLRLDRAPKIVDAMRESDPGAFLVMFKLESGVRDSILLKRALEAMKRAKADLVIANTLKGGHYKGFILGAGDIIGRARSKKELAEELFGILKRQN